MAMKVLSKKENLLLREFCKMFPPVINEKRPTGDFELKVGEEILEDDVLLGKYLKETWIMEGWDSLPSTNEMNKFVLLRTAPEVLFVMPFFRNIGYHPYTDKDGVLHNDEPHWWLGENNFWNKSLRLFKGCKEKEQSLDSFRISFRHLDNKSLSQIKKIQMVKMRASLVENNPEVLLSSDWPSMEQLHFAVPFYTYDYPRGFNRKQKLGIEITGMQYTSFTLFTAENVYESQYDVRGNRKWMFIQPLEPEMKLLNWTALNEEQLREFISVI